MLDVLNLVDNQNENVNEANENNAVNTMLSSGGLAPIFDNKTNEFDVQSEENLNFVDRGNSDVMMTPINSENQDLNNQYQYLHYIHLQLLNVLFSKYLQPLI